MPKIQYNFDRNSFSEMLSYEQEHAREKFIFDVNQVLNIYTDFSDKKGIYLSRYNDPQLLGMIFSLISITYEKDNIEDKLENGDLSEHMHFFVDDNDRQIPAYRIPIAESNLKIGESFLIPEIEFTDIYYPDEIINGKPVYNSDNINNWDFVFDSNIVSVNNGVITALKNGSTIVKLVNKKNGEVRRIKINSGQVRQANIAKYFFSQIRNVIAHGRYTLVNSGLYDTLKEYGSYNMLPVDDRYKNGMQRDIILFEDNQLNVSYDKTVKFNPLYWMYLAKRLYLNDKNPFESILETFEDDNKYSIKNRIDNYTEDEKSKYNLLLILSKFYINFIYNYDTEEKDSFDYNSIPISKTYKGDLSNKQFIYNVRTAIMHGTYSYNGQTISLWLFDRKDNTKKVFDISMPLSDLLLYSCIKELIFYNNMKYNPRVLSVSKEL